MRYVVYVRVSSNQQLREGQGLDIQEDQCRRWLRRGKHRLVEVCSDGAKSGGLPVGDRPGLARALALIAADKADGMVVAELWRLSRDMILQEQLLAELHRIGKQLRSCSETEDHNLEHTPEDPARQLVRRMFGAVGEYDRQKIRLRLKAGRERKLMLGGYAGGGPPYGWAAVRGELVKIPTEQKGIALMRRLRRDGASYRQIGAELERQGFHPRRSRDGKWRPGTISDILHRAELTRPPSPNTALPSPELAERSA